MNSLLQCAKCNVLLCRTKPLEELDRKILPENCPMKSDAQTIQSIIDRYALEEVKKIYVSAAITEKEGWEKVRGINTPVRPRVKELIEFGHLIKVKRIGIAFCGGLRDEARALTDILEKNGYTVASVVCKCGATDKSRLKIPSEYKMRDLGEFEPACNPLVQAELLNHAQTELNVIVGLCLGHDILFTQNSKAPVTTLIVKDRMLGHNPAVALYSRYHRGLLEPQRRT